ncbi:nudix hydrolase 8-like [Strongylocentrotus purpuratus]|uniref:Nudix hydrolase domain-containing protein n=1 Tax=Strongylocentrotus purpuratus TaxID=7668 RepID=A0A7M7PCX6_STRPU|nr:nudix hydrolase 8-like [Strongylocentrotus purpuratus]
MEELEENGPKIFTGCTDVFCGITVATDKQNWSTLDEFKMMLRDSLDHWKKTAIRGIWIKVPLHQADLVGIIAKLGFVFHHAQPNYVMMTRWLPEDEPNMLPGFATHYIGVGGFVLNEKNELLVIQELYAGKGRWKLPGGAVDPKEDLPDAVCREVLEETGISAEFKSIGCFRHLHKFRFGRSDIYFVCHLQPLTSEINMDPREIAACRWMPIEEYLEHPDVHEANRYFARQCLAVISKDSKVNLRPEESNNSLVYSILPKSVATSLETSSSGVTDGESLSDDLEKMALKNS